LTINVTDPTADASLASRFYFFVGIAIFCDDFFAEAIEEV